MQIIFGAKDILTPTVVALGNFDGVHRGHQQVIQALRHSVNAHLTVVSFHPHPQEFFTGQTRTLLTPLSEKAEVLAQLGVEQLVLLPFDQKLAQLSPAEFVSEILGQRLGAKAISVGFNFRFGHQRAGNVEDLQALAVAQGMTVTIATPQLHDQQRISSSAIRQALQTGELSLANRLLGRSYALVGDVITGQQLARQLGFPTANLRLPPEKYLPCAGVYLVQVSAPSFSQPQTGVMNLGYRPTLNHPQPQLSVEVHLLDWSGDLYGQTLTLQLEQFLRPEQKFAGLEALKSQIQADCARARDLAGTLV